MEREIEKLKNKIRDLKLENINLKKEVIHLRREKAKIQSDKIQIGSFLTSYIIYNQRYRECMDEICTQKDKYDNENKIKRQEYRKSKRINDPGQPGRPPVYVDEEKVRWYKKELKYSNRRIARELGVSRKIINDIVNDKRQLKIKYRILNNE